jgi:uncharacterized protein (TIGR02001 family)
MLAFDRTARTLFAAGTVFACLSAAPALAEDKLEWSMTLSGTTDYVFRGISLSNEEPTPQGSFDVTYGIWYAGIWGSRVDGEGYEPVEADLYAGVKPEVGPVTFDFGFVYYTYPFNHDPSGDYVEFKAGAEYSPVKNLTLKPVFWYTPDQDNYDETWTIEGSAAYELPAVGIFTPTISGLIGYSQDEANVIVSLPEENYTYWNAGLALAVDKITFDFRYWDTNVDDNGLADERFVFTTSLALP